MTVAPDIKVGITRPGDPSGLAVTLNPSATMQAFNVKSYGAPGLGLVEESDAVNAAADAAYAAGGGMVFFPDGRYVLRNIRAYERVYYVAEAPGGVTIVPMTSLDTAPVFNLTVTAEVRASQRFTLGGFVNLEIDGLGSSTTGTVRAISSYDLQEVPAASATSDGLAGIYVWLSQVMIDNCWIHNCGGTGIELWGDCRTVWITRNRVWDCGTGIYNAHNHSNLLLNEIRENNIGLDTAQMLDSQITACKFSHNNYGIGGLEGRVNRFGEEQGRLERTQLSNCMFFENHILACRLSIQCTMSSCFLWASAPDVDGKNSGTLLRMKGGSRITGGTWFISASTNNCVELYTASDGLTVTQFVTINGCFFSVNGGGRAITKGSGTNDTQFLNVKNNDASISVDVGVNGGAFVYLPAAMGQFQHTSIEENTVLMSIAQTAHVVRFDCTQTAYHRFRDNRLVNTSVAAQSKGFKALDSTGASVGDNTYVRCGVANTTDVQDLGTIDSTTIVGDSVGYMVNSEQLARVRGTINGTTGAILKGAGFTVVRTPTGLYTVTLTRPFLDTPSVTCTALFTSNCIPTLVSVATGSFQVQVRNGAGTAQDPTELHFTASGPRV